ncbi:MAG TPA: peptide chain release factor aRF-1 [Candidatus Nanoarchaeia archaeon]|nr:peptide chain release factor aRF-1 [Candidatus Nanoarchaeia archaeon]
MALTSAQKFGLKKFLKELETYKGRHTEMVSVYVPAGYEMSKIMQHLAQEQGTAANIKSTATRKNVVAALEKMIQHLRIVGRTPENGLAAFAGNVAEREGQEDIRVWSIEPPSPLRTRIYRCDKEFVLDLLRDMMEVKEVYGLVVMDRREGNIAFLRGKTIVPLSKAKSNVPGKTKAGGQSAHRFERLREDAAKQFYRKLAEMMKEQFFGNQNLKGIIVGGPGPTKYEFIETGQITNELKQKIIAVKDLSYTGEFGLEELVERSQDVLANEEIAVEKKLMTEFFETLRRQPNKVTYGLNEVKRAINMGTADRVLVSEEVDDATINEIEESAKKMGTAVHIISVETREGAQLRDLGKFAAILRYEVHQE